MPSLGARLKRSLGLFPLVVNLSIKAKRVEISQSESEFVSAASQVHTNLVASDCADWERYPKDRQTDTLSTLDRLSNMYGQMAANLKNEAHMKMMRTQFSCKAIDVKLMRATFLMCLLRQSSGRDNGKLPSLKEELDKIELMKNNLEGKCETAAGVPSNQPDDQDCKRQLREKFTVVSKFEGLPSLEKDVQGNMQAVEAMQEAMVEVYHSSRNKEREMKNLGMILYGPPGTGKTFLAKAFARDLQMLTTSLRLSPVTFVQVTPAQVRNKYVGESEKSIETLFKCARALAPTVLFFDEGDAIFGGKDDSSGTSSNSRAELLQHLQGLTTGGELLIPIVATNYLDDIDQAALSRLPRHIYIPLPSRSALVNLTRHYVSRQKVTLPDSSERTIRLPQAWERVKQPSCLELLADKLKGYAGRDVMTVVEQVAQTLQSKINKDSGMKLGLGFLNWLQQNQARRNQQTYATAKLEAKRDMWNEALSRVKASTKEQERKRYEELVRKYSPDMAAAETDRMKQDEREKYSWANSWEKCS